MATQVLYLSLLELSKLPVPELSHVYRLCDFGLARICLFEKSSEEQRQFRSSLRSEKEFRDSENVRKYASATTDIGTPAYMSPELLMGEVVIPAAADSYAFGILLHCLLSGEKPYSRMKNRNVFKQMVAVVAGERPPIDSGWPDDFAHIMKWCWAENPSERPSFPQVVVSAACLFSPRSANHQ